MQVLLSLGGHAHLAEPGCLCTKQALRSLCKQTPGEWARNTQEDQLPYHSKWCGPLLLSEKEP